MVLAGMDLRGGRGDSPANVTGRTGQRSRAVGDNIDGETYYGE